MIELLGRATASQERLAEPAAAIRATICSPRQPFERHCVGAFRRTGSPVRKSRFEAILGYPNRSWRRMFTGAEFIDPDDSVAVRLALEAAESSG